MVLRAADVAAGQDGPELSEIVGQPEAIRRLQQALAGRRMPHALLFVGPEGVGRRTTALALARTLLCAAPATVKGGGDDGAIRQACGRCDDCRMARAGTHGDLHLVYKELAAYHDDPQVRDRVMQELSIDVVRQFLLAPAGQASCRGRGKVFIVLEADLLSAAAQNCLLKTLEEPPPGVRLILIAGQTDELLPTILSRCAIVRFGPLPRPFVVARLREQGVAEAEAAYWAALTDGSIGRASRLAAQGLYPIKRKCLEGLAGLGPVGDPELAEMLTDTAEAMAEGAVKAAGKEGPALAKTLAMRRATGTLLELIAAGYRDALHQRLGAAGGGIVNADQPEAVAALAAKFAPARLCEVLDQLARYEHVLWRNVNPKVVWDNAVITCASARRLAL